MHRASKLSIATALCVAALACCALGAGVASATVPLTAWGVQSVHGPTNMVPGVGNPNVYQILIRNNGAVSSSGTITAIDQLPSGVTTSGAPIAEKWSCTPTTAGASEVTCTSTQTVVQDGSASAIVIPVTVAAGVAEGSTLTNSVTVSGGGALEASTVSEQANVSSTPTPFGIESVEANEYDEAGNIYTQAGGHPYAATASFRFNTDEKAGGSIGTPANLKDLEVELPPGFIGNPQAAPRCFSLGHCPPGSEVGVIYLSLGNMARSGWSEVGYPIYNMVPPKGVAAEFKFQIISPVITIYARVRSNGDYGLTVYTEDASEVYDVNGFDLTFWGTPDAHSHDAGRQLGYTGNTLHPSGAPEIPFLSNPTDCAEEAVAPPVTTLKIDSWQQPGAFVQRSSTAPAVTNCALLSFPPQIAFEPSTSQAGQPTGYDFEVNVPQSEVTGGLATPELKNTTVSLPAGMGVSPSATGGLAACSEAQIALDSLQAGECPLASQVATVAIWTPLLSTQPVAQLTGIDDGELECVPGSWSGEEAGHPLRYRWLRDGTPIAGAEGGVYQTVAADEGMAIQCEAIASNAGGSTVAVSANEAVAPYSSPLPPQAVLLPKVQGAASPGATDSCTTGSWSSSPSSYAYQWLRGGAPIAGATSSSYTIASEDAGKTLQCEVTATNAGGSAVGLSVAAGTVAPAPATTPPLIEPPLKGRVYVAQPKCSPCTAAQVAEGKLVGLYIEAEGKGVRVKLPGDVAVNPANGQLTAHFDANPQLPFEELQLDFKNGPRAPLANPQLCGAYTTTSELEPWSAPDPIDATPSSSYDVDFDGHGAACPSSLPFRPTFSAGTTSAAAAGYSDFVAAFERPQRAHESEERSEQGFAGIQVHTPPGLLGRLTGVPLCEEPQASEGTCSSESQIGVTSVAAGPGSEPLHLKGKVYLTSGYKGAPFGLAIVVPAEAGPFRLAGTTGLGTVVVRAAITIDPETAALTITADPLPQIIDGVILRLQQANVEITRPDFMVNATNCSQQAITATITGAQGASEQFSEPYAASGCANLPFKPWFKASTSAKKSRADGASLSVHVGYPRGASEASIKYVKVELPKRLPSRLNTLQHACLAATFAANPAGCPAESVVGVVTAKTPVLPVPLSGPVYFVSHGGEAFPSLVVVMQGDGVRIDLTGSTFISKKGITSSTFKTVPDAPVESFQLTLPRGPNSALAAPTNLCRNRRQLVMPTTIEGQNGKVIRQKTRIKVSGCAKTAGKRTRKTRHTAAGAKRRDARHGQDRGQATSTTDRSGK